MNGLVETKAGPDPLAGTDVPLVAGGARHAPAAGFGSGDWDAPVPLTRASLRPGEGGGLVQV